MSATDPNGDWGGPSAAERLDGIVARGLEADFFDAAAAGQLIYTRCGSCGYATFPPRHGCPRCGSDDTAKAVSGGIGEVVSVTSIFRAPRPEFAEWVPYQVAIVELDEGFTMLSNVVGDGHVVIGERVEVAFVAGTQRAVPVFRSADRSARP